MCHVACRKKLYLNQSYFHDSLHFFILSRNASQDKVRILKYNLLTVNVKSRIPIKLKQNPLIDSYGYAIVHFTWTCHSWIIIVIGT